MFGFQGYSLTGQLVTKWFLVAMGALVVIVSPTCRLCPNIALVAVCDDRLCLGGWSRAAADIDRPVPSDNRLVLPAIGLTGTGTCTMDSVLKINQYYTEKKYLKN